MATNHKWGEPARFLNKTERLCQRCSVVKVTRHEHEKRWTEFWRIDGDHKLDRRPPCVEVKQ